MSSLFFFSFFSGVAIQVHFYVEVWRKRGMKEGRDEEMMNGSR